MPSRVRAGAELCRARVAHTQCSPTVFVIFLSTMAEASLMTFSADYEPDPQCHGGVPVPCPIGTVTSGESRSLTGRLHWHSPAAGQVRRPSLQSLQSRGQPARSTAREYSNVPSQPPASPTASTPNNLGRRLNAQRRR